jgi:hypothetical protein
MNYPAALDSEAAHVISAPPLVCNTVALSTDWVWAHAPRVAVTTLCLQVATTFVIVARTVVLLIGALRERKMQ